MQQIKAQGYKVPREGNWKILSGQNAGKYFQGI
jgi:hypothetical protein